MRTRLIAWMLLFVASLAAPVCHAQTPPNALPPIHPRVIVFVHGIHGSRDSWRAANGAYWPDLVKHDPRFAYSDVVIAEYPSPATNGKLSSTQLAETLYQDLAREHVWEHPEVVFLAHSLGGILVEEMLLRHPADAAHVRFIVSYGTPHEGSTVARVAALYDKDPLLNDLSDASDNSFLTHLEDRWRGSTTVNGIHRFCAYEGQDTTADDGFIGYFKPHARVVSYFSATYGCDVTTPPQKIPADHVHMIEPADRNAPAYDFFRRVYRDNPILETQTVMRDSEVSGLEAGCDETNANADLPVRVALFINELHEHVLSATATLVDVSGVREISPSPPVVTRIDPDGTAHVNYGFTGQRRKLMVCTGNAHASLLVEFSIARQVPLREP